VSCHPALTRWETAASSDPADVAAWWSESPCSVLLATGRVFDAIEVPAPLGAAAYLPAGPVVITPRGWLFLVAAGDGLRPELATRLDVVLHGPGSWIPAPPTRTPQGPVRWLERLRWSERPVVCLPEPGAVQQRLVAALKTVVRQRRPPGAPSPVPPPSRARVDATAGESSAE
jgi:hypothetical protein